MKNTVIGLKVMQSKKYASVGAECNCGKCHGAVMFGETGFCFHVDGSIKYFRLECYENMKFEPDTTNVSDFDAIHTIGHELLVITNSKETATIKMLQGFEVKAGFGKNAGKYYCRLKGNESCYTSGHYGYPKEDNILEVRVNGKTVKNLKEFREATH